MSIKNRNAIHEYLSNGIVLTTFFLIYLFLPYFSSFIISPLTHVLVGMWITYAILGLPYFIARNKYFWHLYKDSESKSSIALRLIKDALIFTPTLFTHMPTGPGFLRPRITTKERTALLTIIVKFFYIPIMLSFMFGHINTLIQNVKTGTLPTTWYPLLFNSLFFIDTFLFTCGYLFEAKWLRNEIKSVDPFLSGWIVALICYPPFNGATDSFFTIGNQTPHTIISNQNILTGIQILTLCMYVIYVWASVALFTKASNLTNRGIVKRGPYKYVRHPAYISKNIAWFLERLPFLSTPAAIIPVLGWGTIYTARALTEERHLLLDENYRQYVKEVRWRFIPGLF